MNTFEIAQQYYDNQLPPESDIFCECSECGDDIYEGDDYYDIGDIICSDCLYEWANKFKKEAVNELRYL